MRGGHSCQGEKTAHTVHKHAGKKGHEQEPKVAWERMKIRLRRHRRITLESALTLPNE